MSSFDARPNLEDIDDAPEGANRHVARPRRRATLEPQVQRFVDAYVGDASAAARAAGYDGDDDAVTRIGARFMVDPVVLNAIEERGALVRRAEAAAITAGGRVLKETEVKAFWSRMILDDGQNGMIRLRASELLAKSEGWLVEKKQIDISLSLGALVERAHQLVVETPALPESRSLDGKILDLVAEDEE